MFGRACGAAVVSPLSSAQRRPLLALLIVGACWLALQQLARSGGGGGIGSGAGVGAAVFAPADAGAAGPVLSPARLEARAASAAATTSAAARRRASKRRWTRPRLRRAAAAR
jgi:hypothetical protein